MIKFAIARLVAITVRLTYGIYYFPQVVSVSGICNVNVIYTFPIVTTFFSLFACPILATCQLLWPEVAYFDILHHTMHGISFPFIHVFILIKSFLTCLWNVLVKLAGYSIWVRLVDYGIFKGSIKWLRYWIKHHYLGYSGLPYLWYTPQCDVFSGYFNTALHLHLSEKKIARWSYAGTLSII